MSREICSVHHFLYEDVAMEREVEGELVEEDIGQGLPFRAGVFDAAISVSAIQWLCIASRKSFNPIKRLNWFFQSLYECIRAGGRAVLQFYPENSFQMDMITKAALKAGFSGGVIIDFPNSTKAKKYYLVIDACMAPKQEILMLQGKTEEDLVENEEQKVEVKSQLLIPNFRGKSIKKQLKDFKPLKKSKMWILQKKDRQRRQGKEVKPSSKFTGRKRNKEF